jgi:NifU-like protein involved in Fe-S cluster formation
MSVVHGRNLGGDPWLYNETVKEHFFNPKNLLMYGQEENYKADGMGRVGSPACGDEMVIWVKIDPNIPSVKTQGKEKIKECKWQTFGCGSAIAATSMLSVMVTEKGGMTIKKALKIKPQDIMKRLGGLPDRKVHCSVLGDKALRAAINDWFRKTDQIDRIIVEGAKIIDEKLRITDKDIEEAVLEGAQTLEDVQKKLKVGVASPESIPEIEQLIRFYNEKYYG